MIQRLIQLGPEWTAAIALAAQAVIFLAQAFILGWQGLILRRHALTLEEHRDIARTQAETAKLIGQALDQQGKLLDSQNKIMDEQFKFQRRVEAKTERARLLDVLDEVDRAVSGLHRFLMSVYEYNDSVDDGAKKKWSNLTDLLMRCAMELKPSIHITQQEKEYFIRYLHDATEMEQSGNDYKKDIEQLRNFQEKYKDFRDMKNKIAESPVIA
jgi:isocitrate lyase